MPVPVPRISKPCAHPILKPHNRVVAQAHQNPTIIPVPVPGPPSHFDPGEDRAFISSWPRSNSHTSWDLASFTPPMQGFIPGLTAAGDVVVIKGAHAEACIPPMHTLPQEPKSLAAIHAFVSLDRTISGGEDGMGSGITIIDHIHPSSQQPWGVEHHIKEGIHYGTCRQDVSLPTAPADATVTCFTPILDNHSPGSVSGPDDGCSPLTPFADFVDRVVGTAQSGTQPDKFSLDACHEKQNTQEEPHVPMFSTIADIPRQHESSIPTISAPSATPGYKTLVEPLAEWISNYIWKACTTAYSLPPAFSQTASLNVPRFGNEPPSHLAPCIQSILLATLLQPSAVFLSLWYMVRLPIYFGAAPLGSEFAKAAAFQAVFLGDSQAPYDREAMENDAPLRLVVLGFMFANKWLDDHTFSNKTWHTISNIPVQTLNALESRALDAFSYDLSISNQHWSQWLAHLMAHHHSLMSPGRPQPISRPSSNPYTIVRSAIEEIKQVPVSSKSVFGILQPVFLGLEERLRQKEVAMDMDVLEIDLDEDGPLREEYLPKRRASKLVSQNTRSHVSVVDSAAVLPPPAKWSPAGDEPIFRNRTRSSGQYVAVQAPVLGPAVPSYPLHGQVHDAFSQNWLQGASYMPVKQIGFAYDIPPLFNLGQPVYNPLGQNATMTHIRSQSFSYDQDHLSQRPHMRSFSQTGFGHRFDECMDHSIPISEIDARWMDGSHYPYSGPAFLPLTAVGVQPAW